MLKTISKLRRKAIVMAAFFAVIMVLSACNTLAVGRARRKAALPEMRE